MKKSYDFSKAKRNPYAKRLHAQAVLRGDRETLALIADIRAAQAKLDAGRGLTTPEAKRPARKAVRRK